MYSITINTNQPINHDGFDSSEWLLSMITHKVESQDYHFHSVPHLQTSVHFVNFFPEMPH